MSRVTSVLCLLALGLAHAGCAPRDEPTTSERAQPAEVPAVTSPSPAASSAAPAAPAASSAPTAPAAPAVVERIRVPGDLPASIVRSETGEPPRIVFLPGVCSNANAYLQSFPEAARAHGGVVAIEGDTECAGSPGFRTFSRGDYGKQNGRIEAALAAAGVTRWPAEGLTLVGYSQGATISEVLASRWPNRYPRIVLIGSPKDPSVTQLAKTRAVATLSCSLDVPPRMKGAADRLVKAGIPSKYFEMPGCTHGNIHEGEKVFGEIFSWLVANQKPLGSEAKEEIIVGPL